MGYIYIYIPVYKWLNKNNYSFWRAVCVSTYIWFLMLTMTRKWKLKFALVPKFLYFQWEKNITINYITRLHNFRDFRWNWVLLNCFILHVLKCDRIVSSMTSVWNVWGNIDSPLRSFSYLPQTFHTLYILKLTLFYIRGFVSNHKSEAPYT